MTRKHAPFFIAIMLPFLLGAAFQFGGIRHDLVNTVTSSSSLVLTSTSKQVERLTGTTAQTVKLPDATTTVVGWWFIVSNDSTAVATISDAGNNILTTVAAGNWVRLYLAVASTVNGTWDIQRGVGSYTANAVLLGNGSDELKVVNPGTLGYVLTSTGTTTAPTYQAAGGGSSGNFRTFYYSYGGASEVTACSATPCTLYKNLDSDGNTNTISSVSWASDGIYTATITSGRCSAPPVCTVLPQDTTGSFPTPSATGTVSTTTSFFHRWRTAAGTGVNAAAAVNCTCLK